MRARVQAELERHTLEEQLRTAQRLESIGRLAGGIAHDFNNLISVVLAYTGFILAEVPDDDRLVEDLLEIRSAGERAARLIRQLLAFSRDQVLAPSTVHINHLLQQTRKAMTRILGDAIVLEMSMGEEMAPILAEPNQLEHVLINLVVNARDAMPHGGVLSIATQVSTLDRHQGAVVGLPAGDYVTLVFRDNGVGMDARTMSRIFDPFFTTKPVDKGSGLGLAAVFATLKQCRGAIDVQSEPGQGTTFTLYFPVARVDPGAWKREQHSQEDGRSQAPASPEDGARQATVLVVEDAAHLLQSQCQTLSNAGYFVFAASSSTEAQLLCESHPQAIDLLITSGRHSGVNALVLIERLRQTQPNMGAMVLVDYPADPVLRESIDRAGQICLTQAVQGQDLLAQVRELLRREVQGGRRE